MWASQRFEGFSGSEKRTRLFSGRCVHDGEFSVIDSCRRPLQNAEQVTWSVAFDTAKVKNEENLLNTFVELTRLLERSLA